VVFKIRRQVLGAAAIMTLGLVTACGSSSTAGTSSSGAAKTYRIALVLPTISINILHDIYQGALDEAKKLGNATVTETGDLTSTTWLTDCMEEVSAHVDVLMYDSIDGAGNTPCITAANAAGIKVICVVACTTGGHQDATITIDAKNDGELMGKWVVQKIGSGDVGFLEGAPGDSFGLAIGTGFKDAISQCSSCHLVADVSGGIDRNSAYTVGLQVLTAHPTIKAIGGSNDDVGLGLVKAAQQQGTLANMAIAGHGGSCLGLQSILQGQLGFTILIPGHTVGATSVDAALALVQGKSVAATQFIPALGIDTTTAKGILAGTTPNPTNIDVLTQLKAASAGCPS
jgi:ABC-type sugar transport system substrate-binding protein